MSNTSKYALAIAVLLGATHAQATQYKYTDLGGWTVMYSGANGINSKGDVVGAIGDYENSVDNGAGTPILWSGGKQIALDTQRRGAALALNDAGVIVGNTIVNGDRHAAVFANGKMTDLGAQNGFVGNSLANAINNSGQVVGWGGPNGDANYHAMSWTKDGKATDLNAVNGVTFEASQANGINSRGDIVGTGYVDGQWRPVLWSNGQTSLLGATGGTAFGINDHGQVVGASDDSAGHHAMSWTNGHATDLGTLGGSISEASAINNRGDVVGWTEGVDLGQHAVLWTNGQAIDLNAYSPSREWYIVAATGINDKGVIVGYAKDYTGVWPIMRGFMLTPVAPVPEADTYAMMAGGFALLGLLRPRAKSKRLA